MLTRTSCVNRINIHIVSFASIAQIGDSCIVNGLNKALAVQREIEIEYGNEGNFSAYPVFYEPIPFQPINEPFTFSRHNPNPLIKVDNIDIIGISSSSLLHVGNSGKVYMEARVKHIRQLLPISRKEELASPEQEQGQ